MFTVVVEKTDDVAILHCAGRLVRGNALSLLRTVVTAEQETRMFVLDFCEVEVLDAGGLTALLDLHHWTEARGMQLKLVDLSGFVLEVLQRTRLDRVFDISTFHEALVILAEAQQHPLRYAACS